MTTAPARPPRSARLMPAALVLFAMAVVLVVAVLLSPLFGSQPIALGVAWSAWWAQFTGAKIDLTDAQMVDASILDLRLLRTCMALIAGGGLAITGAAFQAILRNPLAAPETMGVTSAAAVGAFLATLMEWTLPGFSAIQASAFAAALVDIGLIYLLARLSGRLSMTSLLLSGMTLSFMASAIVLAMIHLSDPYKIQIYEVWMIGSVEVIAWSRVFWCLVLVVPGVLVLLWQAHNLNPVALGDDFARGRGVAVERTQGLIFLFGSLITAAIVSVVGPIAFVGLIVPHFVRRLVGSDQRIVLLASLLSGAAFLVTADIAVRFASELLNAWLRARGHGAYPQFPVGILTALIGGPVFLYVLIRTQRGAR